MSVPTSLTTTIRIESKGASKNGDTQVKAFCEELGIKNYSTPLYVPDEDALGMLAGATYPAYLVRGKLKDGKQGDYGNEFYWNWLGYEASSDQAAAESPPAQPAPATGDGQVAPPSPPGGSQPQQGTQEAREGSSASEPDAYDPMVLPVLRPSADRYSSHSVLYQEWKRDRHLALMTAKDMKRDDWGPYDVMGEADLYFEWLRQSPPPMQQSDPDDVPPEIDPRGSVGVIGDGRLG